LPHEKVIEFASRLNIKGDVGTTAPSKFYSGSELRKEANEELAYVALAIEGSGVNNPKGQIASALAQRILGAGTRVKRGLNLSGKLASSVVGGNDTNVVATAFSTSYADSGLLGVYVATTPKLIDQATRKAAETLLRSSASTEEVNHVKNMLKADLALAFETEAGALEELGVQALLTGKVSSPAEMDALIDSVSPVEVNNAFKGKLSIASFGNIANVPHIDDL